VQRAIDQLALDSTDAKVIVRLAPFLGVDAAKKLLQRAQSADDETAFYAYLTVGLSRHSDALRVLYDGPRPKTDKQRLSRALALLALGDGAGTSTIANVLQSGPLAERRRVAEALAYMPQKRPRMILYDALEDVDEVVRFHAARVFADVEGIHARRTLVDIMKNGSAPFQKRAARILVRNGYPFRPDEMGQLQAADRVQSLVTEAVRGRRTNLRNLSLGVRSVDEATRSGAFAALGLLGSADAAATRKVEKALEKKSTPEMIDALVTALALAGDAKSTKALESFDKAQARRALLVIWGFASAGPPKSQLDPTHAGEIARAIEGWMTHGLIEQDDQSRAIRAMERCDPLAGLLLARSRIAIGGEGVALRSAVRLIGRSGSAGDLAQLFAIAKKGAQDLRAEAWRAAARVCTR
jgi:HEAT repeat protein